MKRRATASRSLDQLILPNYKQTWANIRKLAAAPDAVKHLTFKDQEYKTG